MTKSSRPDGRASNEAHAWMARLRGTPSPLDRQNFERWYGEDKANRQAYDRIAADWSDRYGLLEQTRVGQNRAGIPKGQAASRPIGYALATTCLALLLVTGLLLFRPGAETLARAEIFTTAIGEIRTVTLPDRSKVTLDTGSRVAVRYAEEERRVELQEGRARFEVQDIAGSPFIVEAGGGAIVASGTIFDVSLAPGGATVALIEGVVDVQNQGAEIVKGGPYRLRAGERLLVDRGGRLKQMLPASQAELRWPSGMLEFHTMPLGQAVAQANRYSNRKIRILDEATARLQVTGTFRAGDTIGFAKSLATAFSLRADETPEGEIVLHPAG